MPNAPDDCVYPVYVALYQEAISKRSVRDGAIEKIRRGTEWLCHDLAHVAQLAIEDALKGLPMRAKVHVCRMESDGRCQRCGQAP